MRTNLVGIRANSMISLSFVTDPPGLRLGSGQVELTEGASSTGGPKDRRQGKDEQDTGEQNRRHAKPMPDRHGSETA